MKQPELVTKENLIKILESGIMLETFYNELKQDDDISRAVWYALRDYHTKLALHQANGSEDWNPFFKQSPTN